MDTLIMDALIMDLMRKMVPDHSNWVAQLPRLTQAQPWEEEGHASDFYCLLDE